MHRERRVPGYALGGRVPIGALWLGLDQVLSMTSNLVVTVVLVRRGTNASLGSFAAVVAVFTVYLVLQRAVVSEPTAAARRPDAAQGPDRAGAASTTLVLVTSAALSVLLGAVAVLAVPALAPLAVCLPLLAVQDNTRYLSSRAGRPWWAVAMDGTWLVALVVAVLAWPAASGTTVVWMWAGCGAVSVAAGAPVLRAAVAVPDGVRAAAGWWRRECASVGRATGFDMVLSQLYAQGAVFVVLLGLGLGAAGQYRAAQSLFGGCVATSVALNMYALPRQRAHGSSVQRVSWLASRYSVAVAAVAVVTLVLNEPAQRLVFGSVVVSPGLAAATALLCVVLAASGAVAVALRVDAERRTRLLLGSRATMVVVGLPTLLLVARTGSVGAVVVAQAAIVLGFVGMVWAGLQARSPRHCGPRHRRRLSPFAVHSWATDTPGVDAVYCALRGLSAARPDRHTDLVVEGFPRSANTFVKAAFVDANPDCTVASHLHVARSVRRAVRMGLPTVVLVRDPVDAVASLLVRDPRVDPRTALRAYQRFLVGVLPVIDRVVVAPFEQAVADPTAVVLAVDERFDRTFAPPAHDPDSRARIRAAVERMEHEFAGGVVDERAVARPSDERRGPIEEARRELTEPRYADLLVACGKARDAALRESTVVGAR
jgi:hypothetical protein